jgi:PAS domain S-box-containing protein
MVARREEPGGEDERRTSAALQESNDRFRRIFEESPLGIVLATAQPSRIIEANAAFARMLGYAPSELVGRSVNEFLHPEERSTESLESERGQRKWIKYERRYLTKSGGLVWARVRSSVVEVKDGRPSMMLGMSEDITERKLAEQKIAAQQEIIRALSTPVLEVRDGLLMVPVIGSLDSGRAAQLTDNLLRGIRATRARVAVLDVTGVAVVDSRVASHLLRTAEAARLMGAAIIISGVSANVAESLVGIGVDLAALRTVADLKAGLEEAEKLLGRLGAQGTVSA